MKRIIAILLIAAMVLGMSVMLAGCKTKIDSGTEAAKLLLANERLDENVLAKIDLGIDGTKVANLNSGTPLKMADTEKYMRLSDSLGVHYTWTEFEQHSHSMVEFTQFMNSIELTVENVAGDIERMKNKVGVTDKWVDSGFIQNEEHLLRVYENKDVLMIKKLDHNALYVCTRYTDESAKNVYEIFSFYQYDDGDSARMRLIYVPGERYEWASSHANGFGDYFIAENSRGYWIATRYGIMDHSASFWPLIIKDGLGYGSSIDFNNIAYGERYDSYENDINETDELMKTVSYSVFDPNNNRELFRIYEEESRATLELYFTGIKDGFVSVSTNDASYDSEDKVYQTGFLDKLVTENGEYFAKAESADVGKFFFSGGYVQHYYGDNFDYGNIAFSINYESGKSLDDYILDFNDYLKSLGLSLYCDMNTVKDSLYHARLYSQEFATSFIWNNIEMSSYENVIKAKQAFIDATDDALNEYEEVKDFPKTKTKQKLSKEADFADINDIVMGENTYTNGKITVSGIGITITDTALFENGLEYVLKLGLSLCDSDKKPISVNTVALKSDNESVIRYSGSDAILTASGVYDVPKNLSRGEYVLVVYAATKDGIRVSKMKELAFVSIEEGKLDSSAMDVEISSSNENLHATYKIKNVRYIKMNGIKESYSYNEIRRVIMQEILAHGYPDSDAVLQYENGSEVGKNDTLGKGTYKMTAYLMTEDGLAQSYVYLIVE